MKRKEWRKKGKEYKEKGDGKEKEYDEKEEQNKLGSFSQTFQGHIFLTRISWELWSFPVSRELGACFQEWYYDGGDSLTLLYHEPKMYPQEPE